MPQSTFQSFPSQSAIRANHNVRATTSSKLVYGQIFFQTLQASTVLQNTLWWAVGMTTRAEKKNNKTCESRFCLPKCDNSQQQHWARMLRHARRHIHKHTIQTTKIPTARENIHTPKQHKLELWSNIRHSLAHLQVAAFDRTHAYTHARRENTCTQGHQIAQQTLWNNLLLEPSAKVVSPQF